jgi:hypothetical protein
MLGLNNPMVKMMLNTMKDKIKDKGIKAIVVLPNEKTGELLAVTTDIAPVISPDGTNIVLTFKNSVYDGE